MGGAVADDGRIFEPHGRGVVGSMAPFMLARLSEKPAGFGDGNELSAAIERMVQGPRLADVWDIDRKIALAFSAWIEMRQRLASYNAVASAPWTEASKRFLGDDVRGGYE
jgi:polyhydroxyalkanoate synthase subunit PhaE